MIEFGFYVLGCDGVERAGVLVDVGAQIGPEFDQKEGVLRTFIKQLFQSAFLFGKFVVNLPDIDGLKRER